MLASSYPRFPGDSSGTFVSSLARAVASLGHTVEVVAPWDPLAKDGPDGPVSVTRFRYSPFRWMQPMGYGKALQDDRRLRLSAWVCALPYFVSAAVCLGRRSWDVLHVHWLLPNGPVGALTRTPMVLTLHGSDVFLAERSRVVGPLARWTLRRAKAVVSCSPEMGPHQVILGGADPDRFGHGHPCVWRDRLGITRGQPVVLALGRLVEKKGFAYLTEACSQVRDAVLVIAGDGPQRSALTRPGVRFTGAVSWRDVPDLMAVADIVVVPSVRDRSGNQDGLPTVALEAMAAGKPVVASRLGGLPLVVEDGKTGLLVQPGDSDALSEAIQTLLNAPDVAATMGRAGRQRVERELNWTNVARQYIEVYEAALR